MILYDSESDKQDPETRDEECKVFDLGSYGLADGFNTIGYRLSTNRPCFAEFPWDLDVRHASKDNASARTTSACAVHVWDES